MVKTDKQSSGGQRFSLAIAILLISLGVTGVLAGIAIYTNPDSSKDILTMVFPVIASWVGTVLAFYFGKENFESANQQIREIIQNISPEEMMRKPVGNIMRRLSEITCLKLGSENDENTAKLSEIREKFKDKVSRLPVLNPDGSPRYIIHASSIDRYYCDNRDSFDDTTIAEYIRKNKDSGREFGFNKGFVLVSEKSTVAEAKAKMEQIDFCQDIFVTKNGMDSEPLLGWISNVRLCKCLDE